MRNQSGQLARTRDPPRAKQSCTENFSRTSHTSHHNRSYMYRCRGRKCCLCLSAQAKKIWGNILSVRLLCSNIRKERRITWLGSVKPTRRVGPVTNHALSWRRRLRRRVHFRVRCAPECSPSPLSPRHSRGRRRPACTPRCRASRTRARIPSTVVISTLVSRLRAAARCQPKPNPKPDPNPNRNPNNPNPDPKQVLALHLHHGARLGAHAAHDLVQWRTWRAEHVRPLPGVRPLHPD